MNEISGAATPTTLALPTITSVLALLAPTLVEAAMVFILFILILIDLVTGVVASYKEKKPITSHLLGKTGEKTLGYYSCYIVVKLVGLIATLYLGVASPFAAALVGFILAFFAFRESFSIIENARRLGVRIPKKLMRVMKGLEDQITDDSTTVQREPLGKGKGEDN